MRIQADGLVHNAKAGSKSRNFNDGNGSNTLKIFKLYRRAYDIYGSIKFWFLVKIETSSLKYIKIAATIGHRQVFTKSDKIGIQITFIFILISSFRAALTTTVSLT